MKGTGPRPKARRLHQNEERVEVEAEGLEPVRAETMRCDENITSSGIMKSADQKPTDTNVEEEVSTRGKTITLFSFKAYKMRPVKKIVVMMNRR